MATIKERIEGVTENVTDGKQDIAVAINNKNARNVSVSTTGTFSSLANAINSFNIETTTNKSVSSMDEEK